MFGLPDFIVKLFARHVENQIGLEDTSMPNVPWYKRLSTWAHIFTALLGVYGTVSGVATGDFNHALPAVPAWLLTIASALGLYDNHAGPSSGS